MIADLGPKALQLAVLLVAALCLILCWLVVIVRMGRAVRLNAKGFGLSVSLTLGGNDQQQLPTRKDET